MDIVITKHVHEALRDRANGKLDGISADEKKEAQNALSILSNQWNIDKDGTDFCYRSGNKEIDISKTPHTILATLALTFSKLAGVRGHQVAARAIKTWIGAAEMFKGGFKPAKSVQQQELMLRGFFAKADIRRVYMQDGQSDEFRAYYVVSTKYHPLVRSKEYGDSPPYITMLLAYRVLGQLKVTRETISERCCLGKTPAECLKAAGIFYESEELREAYVEQHERWKALVGKIGFQCIATGQASEDTDGNAKHSSAWYWRRNVISFDHMGEPSRVVIDVFSEEGDTTTSNDSVDFTFWDQQRVKLGFAVASEGADPMAEKLEAVEDEDEIDEDDEPSDDDEDSNGDEEAEATTPVEVPVYPRVCVFDMRKHRRVTCHISQLTDYVYDTKMGSKLILAAEVRDLLHVLLTNRTMFNDVVAGKGGGICVLCYGPPGTGKTLTAEVYSEVMKRPLYAVQTSQLGMTAATLEDELRRVFARAQRWGAILLLDEADVYVRARGDDLEQNAIVGVFLRTMEYYQGVMFLTTNRIDMIDDAIESRCIAKIPYLTPHPDDQRKIWRVQATQSGTDLSDEEIDNIVVQHSDLSGRDIKNLLKLARMIATYKNVPVTVDTISFVKRFKPTSQQHMGEYAGKGGALELPTPVRKPRGDDD